MLFINTILRQYNNKMNTQLFHTTTDGAKTFVNISQINWTDSKKRIDGHFWVEDEYGNVINDSATLALDWMKEREITPVYLPCENEDGKRYLKEKLEKAKKEAEKTGGEDIYYAHMEEREFGSYSCWPNALLNARRTGRPIKYGFLGGMDKRGYIRWFFGHPDNKYDDFEAPEGTNNIKNERTTHIDEHPYLKDAKQRKIKAEQERRQAKKKLQETVREQELEIMKVKANQAEKELFDMLDKEDKKKHKKHKRKR